MVWPTNATGWSRVWSDVAMPLDYFSRSMHAIDHAGIDWNLVRITKGRTEMKRQIEANEEPSYKTLEVSR